MQRFRNEAFGGDEVEAALERLDRLTDDKAQVTATQTLEELRLSITSALDLRDDITDGEPNETRQTVGHRSFTNPDS